MIFFLGGGGGSGGGVHVRLCVSVCTCARFVIHLLFLLQNVIVSILSLSIQCARVSEARSKRHRASIIV